MADSGSMRMPSPAQVRRKDDIFTYIKQIDIKRSVGAFSGLFLSIAGTTTAWPALAAQDDLAATTEIIGPVLKFDWPAIEVGIASYEAGPTGVTVFRFPKGALGAVDVRGGAPGTFGTDSMRLGYERPSLDAVVFSGGSAYGLEAVAGVATKLKDDGVRSGLWTNIAGVKGAIIYDFLGHRLNEIYPDKRLGQAALHALRPGILPLGAQGAGRMPMQGWFFGCGAHSGQGGAFRQMGDTKIVAFAVVNAFGSITDREGRMVKCNRAPNWGKLTKTSELLAHLPESRRSDWTPPAEAGIPSGRNTTISMIVTNRKLGWAELQRLAVQVHTSMARAIQPFSTFDDGDTLYAVSTNEVEATTPGLTDLYGIAGETMWDAILASVPDEPAFTPPTASVAVAAETLAVYAGKYHFGPNATIAIEVDDRKLMATLESIDFFDLRKGRPTALLPLSDIDFYVDGRYHTRMSFRRDAAGKVTGALVNPGRWQQAGSREAD